ncbi:hypothetical protein B7463_g6723, partial [Scytalidium lignicola]
AVPSAPDAPPVPAIPKHIKTDAPARASRRAASIDAPPTRVASPPPHPASGRGASLGPAVPAHPARRPGHRLSHSLELTGTERRGPTNPPTIRSSNNQNLVYDPNTRSFLPAAQLWAIEQRVQGAANKPVKKMKKIAPKESTGTHFAAGTVGGRLRGTEVDAMEAAASTTASSSPPPPLPHPMKSESVSPETTAPPPKTRKKKAIVSDSGSEQGSYMSNPSDAESESSIPPYSAVAHRPGVPLQKRPSVVHEDREQEEAEGESQVHQQKARVEEVKQADIKPRLVTPEPPAPTPVGLSRDSTLVQPPHPQDDEQPKPASEPAVAAHEESTRSETNGTELTHKDSLAARVHSVSPPRTHFARAPESLLVVHSPPPRSVSPRKSAMKNSNSPRNMSPVGNGSDGRGSSHERSPSSLHISSGMDSDEQQIQRKKSVRVSFDESSNVVLGRSGSPISPESPSSDTSQSKRSWFGFARKRGKGMSHMDDDDDEIMKPRPALPSFGSVRERKPRENLEDRPLVKPPQPVIDSAGGTPPLSTEHSNNSKESFEEPFEEPLGQSSDHAIGGILAQDFGAKENADTSNAMDPLPPQVTSVEGSGYVSDDGSSILSVDERKHMEHQAEPNAPIVVAESAADLSKGYYGEAHKPLGPVKEETPTTPPGTSNGIIPQINILQASPTVEDNLKKTTDASPQPTAEDESSEDEWVYVPGQWGDDDSIEQGANTSNTTATTPASAGIAEPPGEQQQPNVPISSIYTYPSTIAEETEDSDESSVYSDAAEDLSDLQGDGFMSLDAVVDSPIDVNNALPGLAITTPPDSPAVRLAAVAPKATTEEASQPQPQPPVGPGWDKAQLYWSSLTTETKRELEKKAQQETKDVPEKEEQEKPAPKPKKKKAASTQPISQPPRERSYMIQPGAKAPPEYTPTMRTSMRPEPQGPVESHMRSTMRAERPARSSMRSPPPPVQQSHPRGALQKKNRPMSYAAPESELATSAAAASSHARNFSTNTARTTPAIKPTSSTPSPTLRRRGSADSDSSFKRARPSNEGMGMRRTMRGSNDMAKGGRAQSPMGSGRYSLRSLSPTEPTARRPFSVNSGSQLTQGTMRRSMRDSYDAPTLRGSPQSGSKSPLLSFGRSSAKLGKTKSGGPRSSRFVDSSDEEDSRPAFSSRFVDSSDEEDDDEPAASQPSSMPRTMRSTPLRSIPQRRGVEDEDSSDLPDSDDEKPARTRGSIKLAKARQTNGATTLTKQGNTLASGSLRRSGSGRETMGIHPTSPTITTVTATAARPSKSGFISSILRRKKPDPASKVHKIDLESAARRDTPLERSKSDLALLKYGGDGTGSKMHSPKLQKRNPLDAWPLPNESPVQSGVETERPTTAAVDERPVLSNGVNGTNGTANVMGERPALGTRRFTATGLVSADTANTLATGRKKKKFPALRRMFGLDD